MTAIALIDWLEVVCAKPWMGIYLRAVAVIAAYAGIVHIANILGYGKAPWMETPLGWRIGDIAYGLIDILSAIGLWRKSPWAVILYGIALGSQLVIYPIFMDYFAQTPEDRKVIMGLLGTEAVLIAAFILFAFLEK